MSRIAQPLDWINQPKEIPSGLNEILESVTRLVSEAAATNDVIPMSELAPISSSQVEFFQLDRLDRPELDGHNSEPPPVMLAPFAATPSEDAAVREDPFSDG